jgi:hypothetical protein
VKIVCIYSDCIFLRLLGDVSVEAIAS